MDQIVEKIKAYAGKAKDKAFEITRTVSDKTNTVVDQTKLKIAISRTEEKVKEVYAQMGAALYQSYAEGADEYPDVQAFCEKLDELHKEIANLRDQLGETMRSVRCPGCGAYNANDDVFCSKCGERLYNGDTASESVEDDEVVTIVSDDTDAEEEA